MTSTQVKYIKQMNQLNGVQRKLERRQNLLQGGTFLIISVLNAPLFIWTSNDSLSGFYMSVSSILFITLGAIIINEVWIKSLRLENNKTIDIFNMRKNKQLYLLSFSSSKQSNSLS